MSQQNSFLFLPDISGFTEFVSHTEVEHSRHIVAELLELLIDHEELGLTLAEIEGDALFYYKADSVPSPEALIQQVEKMYIKFHSHLKLYEHQRICNCGACSTANNLTLKFFAHAGPLEFIQIKDQRKPYGKEVITAHRLMKNTVPIDDYLLLSEGVYNSWEDSIETLLPKQESQSEYDLGVVNYQYYELTPLLEQVENPSTAKFEKPNTTPLVSKSVLIEKEPADLFELIINFQHRLNWNSELQELKFDENRVNRVGAKHLCVVDGDQLEVETITDDRGPDKLVYGEKTESIPVLKPFSTYFIVEKSNDKNSKLSIEGFSESTSFLARILKPLFKIKIKQKIQQTLQELKTYAESA